MKLLLTEITDIGLTRTVNEDCLGKWYNKIVDGHIFCVADGMGGYGFGDIASKIAVRSVIKDFALLQKKNLILEKLTAFMFKNVQDRLRYHKIKNNIPMFGTTLAVLIFINDVIVCANIGDTRIYSLSKTGLVRESYDHNFVQELLQTNQISEEQAKNHPKKHVLTKALTGNDQEDVEPYTNIFSCDSKKTFIIASDGLYRTVNHNDMSSILSSYDSDQASKILLELAHESGATDNITFQIIKRAAENNNMEG